MSSALEPGPAQPMPGKILIVEDEFLVALQLEDMLTEAGHQVVGIASDQTGARGIADAPQVALVDLNLRDGPSGPAIACYLSERYGTSIIYVTANAGDIGQPAPTSVGVVHKPFSPQAILTAVAYALDHSVDTSPPECLPSVRPN